MYTHPPTHTHTRAHTTHTAIHTHNSYIHTHNPRRPHQHYVVGCEICLQPARHLSASPHSCTCSSGACTQNPRNPRRGFRHLTEPTPLGLKLLGSGRVTEPTAWVKRGFGAVLGVGSVTLHASTALENETPDPRLTQRQSSEPTLFWSFIFQGCAGIRSSVFGVLRISNPANLFPTALTHQLPRAPPGQSTSTSPRGTPCIGSSGAGAGRGSPPRTPCTCSSGAGAGRGSPPAIFRVSPPTVPSPLRARRAVTAWADAPPAARGPLFPDASFGQMQWSKHRPWWASGGDGMPSPRVTNKTLSRQRCASPSRSWMVAMYKSHAVLRSALLVACGNTHVCVHTIFTTDRPWKRTGGQRGERRRGDWSRRSAGAAGARRLDQPVRLSR